MWCSRGRQKKRPSPNVTIAKTASQHWQLTETVEVPFKAASDPDVSIEVVVALGGEELELDADGGSLGGGGAAPGA